MIEVCGYNVYNQLGENSNNKNRYNQQIISPGVKSRIDPSSLLSYSCQGCHAVLVTRENKLQGVGNNNKCQISVTLERRVINEFTPFSIRDRTSRTLVPISAVCSDSCTLYMATDVGDNEQHLIISYFGLSGSQLIRVDTGDRHPVSLFGGYHHTGAIDNEGEVIFIHSESHGTLPHGRVESSRLPASEKASSVAICSESVAVLSLSGRVFISAASRENRLTFSIVSELAGIEASCVSGTLDHFVALSSDGRVFSRGSNSYGELGHGGTEARKEFREISSLRGLGITAVYAGTWHSLFQTSEGKILSCGDNYQGQLLLGGPTYNNIDTPRATTVTRDATFCIAGNCLSLVFIGADPPPKAPNRSIRDHRGLISQNAGDDGETSALKSRLASIRASIESLDQSTAELEASNANLQAELETLSEPLDLPLQQHSRTFESEQQQELNVMIDPPTSISTRTGTSVVGFGIHSRVVRSSHSVFVTVREIEFKQKTAAAEFIGKAATIQSKTSKFGHPNIVRTFGIQATSDEPTKVTILREYLPFSVDGYVSSLSLLERISVIIEVASAMGWLHEIGVFHGHLTPSNVLLDWKHHAKVSDVISSSQTKPEPGESGISVLRFTAPELIGNESECNKEKADVFSFGSLAFFVSTGGEYARASIEEVKSEREIEIPVSVNKTTQELIKRCMSSDPNERPSFKEIVYYIEQHEHELIEGSGAKIEELNEHLSEMNEWTKKHQEQT